MAKPRGTSSILYGLSTRPASSTSLTWFPSVNVIDCMRLEYTLKTGQ